MFVLGHPLDPTVRALGEAAGRRGTAFRQVTINDLRAGVWRHSIGEDGSTRSFMSCLGGEPSCIVNRLSHLTVPGMAEWDERDDDYARAEFRALLISWLSSLGPRVIDRPGGNSLAGADGGEWHDRRAALASGFRLHPSYWSSRSKYAPWAGMSPFATEGAGAIDQVAEVVVVGSRAFGCPAGLEQACVNLAEALGADTLAVMAALGPAGWGFLGCERAPVIVEGEALEALLELAIARSQ